MRIIARHFLKNIHTTYALPENPNMVAELLNRLLKYSRVEEASLQLRDSRRKIFRIVQIQCEFNVSLSVLRPIPGLISAFSVTMDGLVPRIAGARGCMRPCSAQTSDPPSSTRALSALVSEEKEKAIDLYVRLNSLSGFTGFFTKIDITGLPLATIALSLVFTILGLFEGGNTKLYDLANLTLGAFLGS